MASYSDWCNGVDVLLKQAGSATRVSHIDPDALRSAFANGVTPRAFVSAGSFPLTRQAQRRVNTTIQDMAPNPKFGSMLVSSLRFSGMLNLILGGIILIGGLVLAITDEQKTIDVFTVVAAFFALTIWGLLLGAAGEALALLASIDRSLKSTRV